MLSTLNNNLFVINAATDMLLRESEQAELKNLTEDEILELWDWNSGELLATDILDFANAHWRVLSGLI